MDALIAFLHTVYPLSLELENHLRRILKYKTVPKYTYLLKAGDICQNVYFVEQGLFRGFYDGGDQEFCSWFMKEGDVMYAVKSFLSQTESYEAIQALEDGAVYYITYQELQHIYDRYLEFNVHRGILTEKYYMLRDECAFWLRVLNPRERYQFFVDNFTDLRLRLPNKYIASYIGVSIPTMTRLRQQKS